MPVLANAETTTPKCAVLIDFGNGNVSWADIPVNSTLNAFNATQMAAEKLGLDFQYTHYSFGNYITKIGDGNATLTEYWSLWVWNSTEARWDSSMVGPDSIGATTVTAIAYSFGASSSPAPLATPEHRYPWASFRHDDLNTGNQPAFMPNNLTLAWKVDLGNGAIDAPIVVGHGLEAVVTGGILNMTTYKYDTNSTVYVLNQTGAVVWHAGIGTGYQVGSPLIYNGMLIVPSANGKVYAFNALNGTPLWTYDTGSGLKYGVTSSPIAYQDHIIVATGNGNLISLNTNGTKAWNMTIASVIYSSSPAALDGTLYIGTDDGKLQAIAADGSAVQWSLQLGSKVRGSPILLKDEILVTFMNYTGSSPTSGGIAAVSYAGHLLWQTSTDVTPASAVLTASGVAATTYSGIVMVGFNGTVLWNRSLYTGFAGAAASSAGNSIFMVTNEASSRLIALSDANEVFFQQVLKPAQYALSAPTISDGRLFASSDNGNVYAYDLNQVAPIASGYSVTSLGLAASFQVDEVNGTLYHYAWNFGDGSVGAGASANHSYAASGNYNVVLTVTSPDGQAKSFNLTASVTSVATQSSTDNTPLIIVVIAIVVIALIVAVFMFMRRTKKNA